MVTATSATASTSTEETETIVVVGEENSETFLEWDDVDVDVDVEDGTEHDNRNTSRRVIWSHGQNAKLRRRPKQKSNAIPTLTDQQAPQDEIAELDELDFILLNPRVSKKNTIVDYTTTAMMTSDDVDAHKNTNVGMDDDDLLMENHENNPNNREQREHILGCFPHMCVFFEGATTATTQQIPGDVVVTSKHILFFGACDAQKEIHVDDAASTSSSTSASFSSPHDFVLDVSCIMLHAISSSSTSDSDEDEENDNDNDNNHKNVAQPQTQTTMLYCQLEDITKGDNSGPIFVDNNDSNLNNTNTGVPLPSEIMFYPPIPSSNIKNDVDIHTNIIPTLFGCITKAIELNPVTVSTDDDDDDNNDHGGGEQQMMFGAAGFITMGQSSLLGNVDGYGEYGHDHEYGHEDDSSASSTGATQEERHAALNRLDALLVVPPGLEILNSDDDEVTGDQQQPPCGHRHNPGQFDDADE
jgi:hypothetical protein